MCMCMYMCMCMCMYMYTHSDSCPSIEASSTLIRDSCRLNDYRASSDILVRLEVYTVHVAHSCMVQICMIYSHVHMVTTYCIHTAYDILLMSYAPLFVCMVFVVLKIIVRITIFLTNRLSSYMYSYTCTCM